MFDIPFNLDEVSVEDGVGFKFCGELIRGSPVRNETPRTARQFHFCEDEVLGVYVNCGLRLLIGNSAKTKLS